MLPPLPLTQNRYAKKWQKLLQFTTLNKVQLQQFIKRITVDADRHVTIQFAFQEPHSKDQSIK